MYSNYYSLGGDHERYPGKKIDHRPVEVARPDRSGYGRVNLRFPLTAFFTSVSMANFITLLRLILLFCFIVWVYRAPPGWQLANVAWLGVIFLLDAVDGAIARRRGESSVFGAVFDITADRVVENVLWLVLVDLDWVPVWVGVIFLTRSFLVDSLRSQVQVSPFEMMRTYLGRFLVKGQFMRFSYALVKFLAFAWLFMLTPLAASYPGFWNTHRLVLLGTGDGLIYLAVAMCLMRGLPVLIESLWPHLATQNEATSHDSGSR